MDDKLHVWNGKRGTVKSKLTSSKKFLDGVETKINEKSIQELKKEILLELEIRLEKNCNLNSEFDEIQAEIEMICPQNELNNQFGKRTEFDTDFYPTISRAKQILEDFI